jgi:hypothetical protein
MSKRKISTRTIRFMPKTFIRRKGRRAARQKNFGRTRLQSLRQSSGGLPSRLAAKSLPAENPKNVFLPRSPPAFTTKYLNGHKSITLMGIISRGSNVISGIVFSSILL